jgi:hypothetical protein
MARFLFALLAVGYVVAPAPAYVEAPMSLGALVQQSVVICSMVVTKVDKANNLIIFQKVADIKGKHPQDTIKHNIGKGGLRPGEWQEIMTWAEVGKPAIFCHNGSASETYIGPTWYQAYPNGEWWGMSHGEPFLLRTYAGKVAKFPQIVKDILDNKEVSAPCRADGDKEALHKKTAKMQRMKVSLKLQDYNPKRDFISWGGGGDDIRRVEGMPGFEKLAPLGTTAADAQSVSVLDFDGDGRPDICLCGANKVTLLKQEDDGFADAALPGFTGGGRAAVWADFDGDGLPDLLLATPTGLRFFTNLGKDGFRDDTALLPPAAGAITAAAWGDFDGDGKPDILYATPFNGLRLLKNVRTAEAVATFAPPKLGPWHAIGPFAAKAGDDHFGTAFGPEGEKEIDRAMAHPGKQDKPVKWVAKPYTDGQISNLQEFGGNCAAFVTRVIECASAAELPISLGSDDTLTVWLNGEKLHSENVSRACAPDQAKLTLKLRKGKNHLLLKVCNGDGDFAFYFNAGTPTLGSDPLFADVSAAWGLGDAGIAGNTKGDSLAVADFDNDGKPDVLFGTGTGMVLRNLGTKFEVVASGVSYKTGKVGPALCDFDGDGLVDVFVPQADGGCKLFKNAGGCKFADVTATAGDLGKNLGCAVGAAWGDFDNDGKPDLLVTCLKGTNRYFKNNGDGTFADKSAAVGIHQKVYNTQAAAFADLNNDGRLDLVLHNEGQESVALFGGPADASKWTPIVVKLPKEGSGVGSRVVVKSGTETVARAQMYGGDGRGGQGPVSPRFVLPPGAYTVSVTGTDGKTREKAVTVVEKTPMKVVVE